MVQPSIFWILFLERKSKVEGKLEESKGIFRMKAKDIFNPRDGQGETSGEMQIMLFITENFDGAK
jgi:hypothetical protein